MVYLGPPLDGWGFARYIENTHCGKLLEKTQHSIAEVIYNVITLDVMCHLMRHIMSTHYAHLEQFLKQLCEKWKGQEQKFEDSYVASM